MSDSDTETTDTAASTTFSNLAEEVGNQPTDQTGPTAPTATVAAAPEQYTCCVPDCGYTGTVDGFRVQDFKALIQLVLATKATPSTSERVVITPELVAQYAVCDECAGKIRDAHGVVFYTLASALERSRNFRQKTAIGEALVGTTSTPVPMVEAQVLVACCVCEEQITRGDAVVVGWWGAKFLANRILGREGGLATNAETNQMLVNNTGIGDGAEKVPAVCKDCIARVQPRMREAVSSLTFVRLMGDEERTRQFARNFKPMSLAFAIRKVREYEAKGAVMKAAQEAERAKNEEAERANAEKEARLRVKLEAFLGAAVGKPRNGGGKQHRDNSRARGGGNRKRWDRDE
jgi:hypothetical protein